MYVKDVRRPGEVLMFATIKSLIPEPRQADQPRHYVGRHRQPETIAARATVAVIPAPSPAPEATPAPAPPATPAVDEPGGDKS
jgi:hypothetical protein